MTSAQALTDDWFRWEVAKADDVTVRAMRDWAAGRTRPITFSLDSILSLPDTLRHRRLASIATDALNRRCHAERRYLYLDVDPRDRAPIVMGFATESALWSDTCLFDDFADDDFVVVDHAGQAYRVKQPVDGAVLAVDDPHGEQLRELLVRALITDFGAGSADTLRSMSWEQLFAAVADEQVD